MRLRSGAKAADAHPRPAPARPRPLDFPHYQVHGDIEAAQQYARDLNRLFLGLEKGVSPLDIEGLNITLLGEVPLDRMVPEGYLPPKAWFEDPSTTIQLSSAEEVITNPNSGKGRPGHKEFHTPAKELRYHNDVCFDSIPGRLGGKGPGPVKLSHTSKFYQNLLLMAESWDTSKDHYTMDEEGKEMYTGRRYGAGHEMPPHYREDTISAFVELCAWPFQCNIQLPRLSVNRNLQFQDRYFLIHGIMSTVCRNSTDRQKARRGILEGPLVGIQCRNATEFRTARDRVGEGKEEILHHLLEVGAAVLLAQKRAREGKKEDKPWNDKYWTNAKRRHLGELGGYRQDFETDVKARMEIQADEFGLDPMDGVKMEKKISKAKYRGKNAKDAKKTTYVGPHLAYWNTKPPESLWEPKVEYRMIGKEPGAGVDHVRPQFHPFRPPSENHLLSFCR